MSAECPPGVHSMFDFCPEDCGKPIGAREKLLDYVRENQPFLDMPIDPETGHAVDDPQAHVGRLLDAFAHELAEKIRAEVRQLKADRVLEPDKDWTAHGAADLIDPEERDS